MITFMNVITHWDFLFVCLVLLASIFMLHKEKTASGCPVGVVGHIYKRLPCLRPWSLHLLLNSCSHVDPESHCDIHSLTGSSDDEVHTPFETSVR
ncbi:hypothetical protein ABKN59_006790 [Abortiporus biennis]